MMPSKENRPARRPVSLSVKRCITFAKEITALNRSSRRLRLGCPRRGAPASSCQILREAKSLRGRKRKLNAICRKEGTLAGNRQECVRGQFSPHSNGKEGPRPRGVVSPDTRKQPHEGAEGGLAT